MQTGQVSTTGKSCCLFTFRCPVLTKDCHPFTPDSYLLTFLSCAAPSLPTHLIFTARLITYLLNLSDGLIGGIFLYIPHPARAFSLLQIPESVGDYLVHI
jgi:hypothetical protein